MNRLNKLKVYLKDKTNTLFNTITDRLKRYIFGTEEDRSHYTELLPFIFTAGELALIGLEEPEESVLSSVNLTGISVQQLNDESSAEFVDYDYSILIFNFIAFDFNLAHYFSLYTSISGEFE